MRYPAPFTLRVPGGRSLIRAARRAIFGAAAVAITVAANAELTWQSLQLSIEPPAGAPMVEGTFRFTNRGPKLVRIVGVEASCGCTVATLDRDTFLPGADGSIRALYNTEGRHGANTVAITVTTNEPEVRTYSLALEVRLQEFATLSPQVLTWRVGEKPEAKSFQVRLANGFQFVGVGSANPQFVAEVAERRDDSVEVRVTPRDLWAKRGGVIRVQVAQPGRTAMEVTAMVRVL